MIRRASLEHRHEEEDLDDPMKWSKEIQDQSLTYCKCENEYNCFGNCMSCHKVGVMDFLCLCQEEVHFVHHTFKEALPQEEGEPPSRQVLDPVIWASLHGQLGASAYSLHQMQPKDYLPPSYWGKEAEHLLKFLSDDDNDLINVEIAYMLKCMNENQATENDFQFLCAVGNAMSIQGLQPVLLLWKETEDQED